MKIISNIIRFYKNPALEPSTIRTINRIYSGLRSLPVLPRTRHLLAARKAFGGELLVNPYTSIEGHPVRKVEQHMNRPHIMAADIIKGQGISEDTQIDARALKIDPQTRFGEPNNISSEYVRDPSFYGSTKVEVAMAKAWYIVPFAKVAEIMAHPLPFLIVADILYAPVDIVYFAASKTYQAISRIINK